MRRTSGSESCPSDDESSFCLADHTGNLLWWICESGDCLLSQEAQALTFLTLQLKSFEQLMLLLPSEPDSQNFLSVSKSSQLAGKGGCLAFYLVPSCKAAFHACQTINREVWRACQWNPAYKHRLVLPRSGICLDSCLAIFPRVVHQCMDSDRMVQIALIAGAACLTVGLLRKLQGRSDELKQTEGSEYFELFSEFSTPVFCSAELSSPVQENCLLPVRLWTVIRMNSATTRLSSSSCTRNCRMHCRHSMQKGE